MRAALISDTHLAGGRPLPERLVELARDCDAVIHAGDFSDAAALAAVEAIGPPLHAVHGNVETPEVRERLPAELAVGLDGARIAVIHDAGPARGRLERLRERFPGADAVVFGHSHMPLHERADGFQIFNPGSPTQRRRAPARTMGVATVAGGAIRFEHVELP